MRKTDRYSAQTVPLLAKEGLVDLSLFPHFTYKEVFCWSTGTNTQKEDIPPGFHSISSYGSSRIYLMKENNIPSRLTRKLLVTKSLNGFVQFNIKREVFNCFARSITRGIDFEFIGPQAWFNNLKVYGLASSSLVIGRL